MRLGAVVVGLSAWTAAIVVPAAYVVMMAEALGRADVDVNLLNRAITTSFNSMPLLMWLYVLGMGLIGALLVAFGITVRRQSAADELSV